jgi:starch-binding outer membrane protein, SusD/RagB family
MKLYKPLTLALTACLTVLTYNACKEKNLDVAPTFLTEDAYFTDESEFERAVRATYAKMTDFYWYATIEAGSLVIFSQLPGDDITTQGDRPQEIFSTINPSDGIVNRYYRAAYQLINRANVVLEKGADTKAYKSEETKKRHRGEALFLRGMMYYNLANYFGTSPLILERISDLAQTTPAGSTDTQLIDQSIKDLTEAATLLPLSWDDQNRGRATANAANGYLARALMSRGSIRKNNADFTAAIAAIDKIKGASLMPKFDDNFASDTENNAESLFEFQASQPGFDNVWLSNDFGAPVGSMSAYWGFYENHWSIFGGFPFVATQKLINAYDEKDPRRDITLDPKTAAIKKYITRDRKSQSGVGSVNNPRLMRYADALLLKAEAIAQSGGSLTEAVALVNQVRTRARNMVKDGVAPANRPASTDKAQVLTWIMNERFIELAGEGDRFIDLRRWHLNGLIQLNTNFFNSANSKANFDPAKHLLMPIPSGEIDLNPNVKQNPGY